MSLAERRWLRIFTLCVLYVAQGIPWGFMATTLPGYLIERKVDFSIVATMIAFTTFPYAFKWVWGPIIDTFTIRRFGRRRPWIIFAQAMMVATIAAMVALDVSTETRLLTVMIFIHTVFNALQDVAVDALAVDILPDNERGSANGLMYGAKYGGGALGGVGMAKLIEWQGLDTALTAQACVLLAIMFVPLLVRERDGDVPPRMPARELASALQQAFSLRSTMVAAIFMLGVNFANGLLAATGNKLFVDTLKWKYDEYAEITGGWGLLAGCVSAAAAGFLSDRFGRRALASVAALGLVANWLFFAFARGLWTDHTYVYVSAMLETTFAATMSVSVIALCMDLSWPRVGGSQFTAYMALSNFSTTLGSLFSSVAITWWSFENIWIVGAIVQLAVIALLVPVDPGQTRRELPYPAGAKVPRFPIVVLLTLLVFLIGMTAYVTYRNLR